MTPHLNRLNETVQMRGHNIHFYAELRKSMPNYHHIYFLLSRAQGPVVQSMVSLTSSLRGQLVKYFMTLLLNTLKFFVEKMREAFAKQKLHTIFPQKILASIRY